MEYYWDVYVDGAFYKRVWYFGYAQQLESEFKKAGINFMIVRRHVER